MRNVWGSNSRRNRPRSGTYPLLTVTGVRVTGPQWWPLYLQIWNFKIHINVHDASIAVIDVSIINPTIRFLKNIVKRVWCFTSVECYLKKKTILITSTLEYHNKNKLDLNSFQKGHLLITCLSEKYNFNTVINHITINVLYVDTYRQVKT